ncbi:MAG: SDR family oxidoreductase [Verrucomicrobiales bacterium]|nr:SDR family oxidoreductase [Verrucomicrobiales bacterium]
MNRVIVVTGGGRGIGAATCRLAARHGYAVCVNYRRDRLAAESLVTEMQASGTRAIAVAADAGIETDVKRLFATVDELLGPIAALVNNAGILEAQMRVDAMDAARLNRIFATNVVGAFLCAREAVRRMSTKYGGGGGSIVNVSSAAARLGSPGEYVDYAASKGAIDTLTTGLALEVAEEGIRVNAVRPGFIYTELHANGGEPDRVERVKNQVPMKRGGSPEEVAHAILWLLSDLASFTTGAFCRRGRREIDIQTRGRGEVARRPTRLSQRSSPPSQHRPFRAEWSELAMADLAGRLILLSGSALGGDGLLLLLVRGCGLLLFLFGRFIDGFR